MNRLQLIDRLKEFYNEQVLLSIDQVRLYSLAMDTVSRLRDEAEMFVGEPGPACTAYKHALAKHVKGILRAADTTSPKTPTTTPSQPPTPKNGDSPSPTREDAR